MQSTNLTPRQSEVLALLLEGHTNKEIARALAISPFTVRAHVAAVMQHFGAKRRQDLPVLCRSRSQDRPAMAGGTPLLPAIPRPAVRPGWLAGVAAVAGLALVIAVGGIDGAEPGAGWAAAGLTPEVLILKSVGGKKDTEIRIDTIAVPRIETRQAFLHFSRAHLATAMAQQRLGRHRFEAMRIDAVDCLAYAGVSAPAAAGGTYTHAKGYLCQHPRRRDAAIRIGAVAEGRTGNFADSEDVRAVLRNLLENAAAR